MPSAARSGDQSKAIELTHLTGVVQYANGLECNRTHPFDSGSAGCKVLHGLEINQSQSNSPVRFRWRRMPSAAIIGDQSKAIELIHLTRIAQEAKDCMVWGAIEGNQSQSFDSWCRVMHNLGCNRYQSNSSV